MPQVPVDERDEHARLGIAEAHVELQDARDPGLDHEPHEEDAAKRRPFFAHAAERWLDDEPLDLLRDRPRDDRRGRVSAHAARVRALVAVADALVILRGGEREEALAVGDDVEARLLAWEELLDDDGATRIAERAFAHRGAHRGERLVRGLGDDDPLACREPIRLDDERAVRGAHVRLRGVRVVEDLEGRGRDLAALQEALHEGLRALERRGRPRRAERADPLGLEGVDEARDERRLRTHDDELDRLPLRRGDHARDIVRAALDVARLRGGPSVSGQREDLVPVRREAPNERVLARSGTDDHHAHGPRVMYHGFRMSAKPPAAIRITRPYQTDDEFLAAELETISRTGVVLVGAQQRPDGVVLRFELALASGAPLIRGEGRVIGYKPNAFGSEPGLALRFTRLDSKSKALVDRAAALRRGPVSSPRIPEPGPSGDIPVEVVPAPTSSADRLAPAPESAPEPPPPPAPPDHPPLAQARERDGDREGMLARLRERAAAISPEVRERIFADGATRRRR